MMMPVYNEVNLANVVVVVPGRALKGVALGGRGQVALGGRGQVALGGRGQQVAGRSVGGASPGFVGGAGRLGVGAEEREGRLDPGRAVVPAQRVFILMRFKFFFLPKSFDKFRFKCFFFTKSNSEHLSQGRVGGGSRSGLREKMRMIFHTKSKKIMRKQR